MRSLKTLPFSQLKTQKLNLFHHVFVGATTNALFF